MLIERRSATSSYHGIKISGPQHSFLTEMPICIVKQSKKGIGYRFVPECNNAEKRHTCQFFPFFPGIFAEPQFVELQKFSDHEMAM